MVALLVMPLVTKSMLQSRAIKTAFNQRRHGDAHYIAPSAPLRGRACCKR